MDADFGVYEGNSFRIDRFVGYLARRGIWWPRTPTGQPVLRDKVFKQQAELHPELKPLRELRATLAQMRLAALTIGGDARNRCLLSPFRSTTGRNQPSNSRFIFGPAKWMRCLIQPPPGYALAYIDWGQQEFAIAAHLSGDEAMQRVYDDADPYLAFAKMAGAVPAEATKETHPRERELFKACVLATQYGMGAQSFAQRIRQTEYRTRRLLDTHRKTFPTFWSWSDNNLTHAFFYNHLQTVFGWRVGLTRGKRPNERSLQNFPMQANAAEMLRVALILATERGIEVCAPIHDAVLVAGPADEIEDVVNETQKCMAEASGAILDGFELKTDVHIVRHPDRYMPDKDEAVTMWNRVQRLLRNAEKLGQ